MILPHHEQWANDRAIDVARHARNDAHPASYLSGYHQALLDMHASHGTPGALRYGRQLNLQHLGWVIDKLAAVIRKAGAS